VTRGIRRLVILRSGLLRLIQVVTRTRADVDLARPPARQARRGIGDAPDDQLLEAGVLRQWLGTASNRW